MCFLIPKTILTKTKCKPVKMYAIIKQVLLKCGDCFLLKMIRWKYYLTQIWFYGVQPMPTILRMQQGRRLYAYQAMMGTDVLKNFLFAMASDDDRWPYECFDLARMFHKQHARLFHLIMASFSLIYSISLYYYRHIPREQLLFWFSIHLKQDWIELKTPNRSRHRSRNKLKPNHLIKNKVVNQSNNAQFESNKSKPNDIQCNQANASTCSSTRSVDSDKTDAWKLFSKINPKSLYDPLETGKLKPVDYLNLLAAADQSTSLVSNTQEVQLSSSSFSEIASKFLKLFFLSTHTLSNDNPNNADEHFQLKLRQTCYSQEFINQIQLLLKINRYHQYLQAGSQSCVRKLHENHIKINLKLGN